MCVANVRRGDSEPERAKQARPEGGRTLPLYTVEIYTIKSHGTGLVCITSGPSVNALPPWCCVQAPNAIKGGRSGRLY